MQAYEIAPQEAGHALGELAFARQDYAAAISHLQAVLYHAPQAQESRLLLARCYYRQSLYHEAIQQFESYNQQQNQDYRGFLGLAECHFRLNQNWAQKSALEACLERAPGHPHVILQLAQCLLKLAKHTQAQALLAPLCQRPMDKDIPPPLQQAYEQLYPNLQAHYLMALYGDPQSSDTQLFAALDQGLAHYPKMEATTKQMPDTVGEKLRVGYLSRDFCESATAQLLVPLLQAHSERITVFLYDDGSAKDALNQRLRQDFQYRDIQNLDHQQAASLIRTDQLHLLVDVHGLTHPRRQPLFAARPAPVHVSGPGFLFSAGHPANDILCSGPILNKALQSAPERVYPLKNALCWQAPEGIALSAPPVLKQGHISLGCANGSHKLNHEVLRLWASILKALPQADLHLKAPNFNESALQEQIKEPFLAAEIEPERLHFWGPSAQERHIKDFYRQIDIALDPFPYQGGLNTLEALWMGVPVVVMDRPEWHSRALSVSLFHSLGLEDWLCPGPEAYLTRVCDWAERPKFLREQRRSLRPRLARSGICQIQAHVEEIEKAYFQAWQAYTQNA